MAYTGGTGGLVWVLVIDDTQDYFAAPVVNVYTHKPGALAKLREVLYDLNDGLSDEEKANIPDDELIEHFAAQGLDILLDEHRMQS